MSKVKFRHLIDAGEIGSGTIKFKNYADVNAWYDYKFENNVLQIYKALYTLEDNTVYIKSEPSLQLTDYQIIEGNFFPNDEIELTNVLDNNTYEFVATPDFEGLVEQATETDEISIACEGYLPLFEGGVDFRYIAINPVEKSIIFPNVNGGEGDETDWGYKNGVWGYDKNGTRVADDRIRTVTEITTIVALSDEVYAFWQKNTKTIPAE